jgi:signal peptidase I
VERLRRFVVAEDSMRPALDPGDGLLAVPLRRPRRGSICIVRRPGDGDLWLVKRIAGVPGDVVEVDGRRWPVGDDEVFVLSDDRAVTTADSRRYGPLPRRGAYRVVLRVPRRLLGRARDDRARRPG